MSEVCRVRVVVLEDDHQVAELDVGYYYGQRYQVQVVTPDGVDAKTAEREIDAFTDLRVRT